MRKELVDLKEIAKLAPPDKSIVNRYKRVLIDIGKRNKKDAPATDTLTRTDSNDEPSAQKQTGEAGPSTSNADDTSEVQKIASAFLNSLITKPLTGSLEIADGEPLRDEIRTLEARQNPVEGKDLVVTPHNGSNLALDNPEGGSTVIHLASDDTGSLQSSVNLNNLPKSDDNAFNVPVDTREGEHSCQINSSTEVSKSPLLDKNLAASKDDDDPKIQISEGEYLISQISSSLGSRQDTVNEKPPSIIGDCTSDPPLDPSAGHSLINKSNGSIESQHAQENAENTSAANNNISVQASGISDRENQLDQSTGAKTPSHSPVREENCPASCGDISILDHGLTNSSCDEKLRLPAEPAHHAPAPSDEVAYVIHDEANESGHNSSKVEREEKSPEISNTFLLSPPNSSSDVKCYVNHGFDDSSLIDDTTVVIHDNTEEDKLNSSKLVKAEKAIELDN